MKKQPENLDSNEKKLEWGPHNPLLTAKNFIETPTDPAGPKTDSPTNLPGNSLSAENVKKTK